MSVANLTRYQAYVRVCDDGRYEVYPLPTHCGPYVKFEEAVEASLNSIQQLKAEILLLIQRTKQCACADDMGSVKGLLEQIDAKLSAV